MSAFRTRLKPPALEAEFRADGLASDKRVTTGLAVVTIAFLIVTIPGTFPLISDPERLHLVWAIRVVDFAVAVAALFLIRRVDRPRSYDAITSGWVAIWFVGIVVENALLPATLTDFIWWDVFLTVAAYSTAPLPFPRQAALAAIISGGDLLVLWKFKSPGPSFSMLDVSLAYICANVVGAFVAQELHGWRRRAFLALRHQVAVRTELETALHEVKTLQGIIPICSHCKNIRTDAGDWQRVEAYVRAHSDAEFSHGICPVCMRQHYPELADT
jgi:hypothetical protein